VPKITVRGGDFAKGAAWFYSGGHFELHDRKAKPEAVPLACVVAAYLATEIVLSLFGADEALRADFERADKDASNGDKMLFLASFDDGRLLLASTDLRSFKLICLRTPLGA
jgi:hypothetical protein